jgi:hypothetical protein
MITDLVEEHLKRKAKEVICSSWVFGSGSIQGRSTLRAGVQHPRPNICSRVISGKRLDNLGRFSGKL